MLGLVTVYIALVYVFSKLICLVECFLIVSYVQVGVNICTCMLYFTSMLPPMRRLALNYVQQS